MDVTVIPAGTEFDEGKKGPWLKLTWEEAKWARVVVGAAVIQARSETDVSVKRPALDSLYRKLCEATEPAQVAE